MKRRAIAATLILGAMPFASNAQAPVVKPTAVEGAPVIGTFDRPSIVVAFYRSPLWAAILADRRFELEAVKTANDSARVKELEKYGGESQERAMQQLAGKAPIDNILAVLQPEIKDLSSKLKLANIVDSSTTYPNAISVDVTPLLMDWLKASYETRKMAADLHTQKQAPK